MRCRGSGSATGELPEKVIGSISWAGALKSRWLAAVTCPACCQHRETWWNDSPRPTNFSEHEEI